ncbi:MAG: hypothetical protein IJF58_00745 [Clostridia bacterium]|nr:hypothetical protein [Clostridia bacterium]
MKKLLALVLVLIMALCFTACGDDRSFDDVGGSISTNSTEVSSEADVAVDLGGVEGTTYKNTSVGVQLVAPEGWAFYDAAQMAELNSDNTDLEAANTMFDMMAVHTNGNNVSLAFENLGKLYGSIITEDKYAELAKKNLESSSTAIKNVQESTATVAGESWKCLTFTQTVQGIEIKQISAFKKCGKYMALITATGVDMTPEQILAMFTKA